MPVFLLNDIYVAQFLSKTTLPQQGALTKCLAGKVLEITLLYHSNGEPSTIEAITRQSIPMQLNRQELRWAQDIKRIIENVCELGNLNDFMYAQIALITKGDVDEALAMAYRLQVFREEHQIRDSLADGMQKVCRLMKLFPTLLLSLDSDGELATTNNVCVFDYKGYRADVLSSQENVSTWLGAWYYILTSLCPDFRSIREGAVVMAECHGFDWKQHLEIKMFQRFWSELGSVYPIRFQKWKHFHSGLHINLLFSMSKGLIPEDMAPYFEFGCQSRLRLDEMYLTPTLQLTNERVLSHLRHSLAKRYNMEASFSLPTIVAKVVDEWDC